MALQKTDENDFLSQLAEISKQAEIKPKQKEPTRRDELREGLKFAMQPEFASNFLLPLLGIAETVASGGRSPGTGVMQHAGYLQRGQALKEAREAREVTEGERRREALEKKKKETEEAYKKQGLEKLATLKEGTPEYERTFAKYFPEIRMEKIATRMYKEPKEKIEIPEELLEGASPMERLYAKEFPGKYLTMKTKPDKEWTMTPEEEAYLRKKADISAQSLIALKGDPFEQKQFDQAAKLRNEYKALSDDYLKVKDSYKRVEGSARQSSAAGDLALIFNYMKILDPGSVVRESEFQNAATTGAFGERIKALVSKLAKGERLSPVMRNDFVSRARMLYNEQLNTQKKQKENYEDLAKNYGLSPEAIVGGISLYEPPQAESLAKPETVKAGLMPEVKTESEYPIITTQEEFNNLPSEAYYREEEGGTVFQKP